MRFIKRYVLIITSCIMLFNAVAVIPEFKRNIASWEDDYKTGVVSTYTDDVLKAQFEALRLSNDVPVPEHIDRALATIISIPIGKEVIQSIVASLEPRVCFVKSLGSVITYIEQMTDSESALRTIYALCKFIDPTALDSVENIKKHIENMLNIWQAALSNDPKKITLVQYKGDLFTNDFQNLLEGFLNGLKIVYSTMLTNIQKYQFNFGTGEDRYSIEDRTIYISNGKAPKVSVVSGPELTTCGVTVGYIASYKEMTDDERALHEILHYYHVTLRNETDWDFQSLGVALVRVGFDPSYTGILCNAWTHPEELKTISGLMVLPDGQLRYCKESESRYLFEKRKGVRFSHSAAYCTKVPKYFINVLQMTGIEPKLEDLSRVVYIRQLDDLI